MRDTDPTARIAPHALRAIYVHGPGWLREVADASRGDVQGVAIKLDVSTDPEGVALTEAEWTEVAPGRWRDPYTRQVFMTCEALKRVEKDSKDKSERTKETNREPCAV